jgi:Lar family restriction alleviation protein
MKGAVYKKEKMMKERIIKVWWEDSNSTAGWQEDTDCKTNIAYCETVGFVVEETKDAICIALSRCTTKGNNPYAHLVTIPKCCIKKRKVFTNVSKNNRHRHELRVIPQGELNVCPFCGGYAHLEFDDTYTKPFGHYAECNKCAATSGSCDSKENAIKTWNKRANREPQTV